MSSTNYQLLKKMGLLPVSVPKNKKAQEIMDFYKQKAFNKSELERIFLAKELLEVWKKERVPFPPPAVPKRGDYWYLIQLYFMNRHVHKDKRPYVFDLEKKEEIFIDNHPEFDYKNVDYIKNESLLGMLIQLAKIHKLLPTRNNSYNFSRALIDKLITLFGNKIVNKLGLDSNELRLSIIPFDIYLRLSKKMNFGEHIIDTFFDGYRLRTDGKKTALYGGNIQFGGARFIDSIWMDILNKSIIPRLVVIRKNYGS